MCWNGEKVLVDYACWICTGLVVHSVCWNGEKVLVDICMLDMYRSGGTQCVLEWGEGAR